MKLKYKYIHFEETSEIIGGKVVWVCKGNKRNDILIQKLNSLDFKNKKEKNENNRVEVYRCCR